MDIKKSTQYLSLLTALTEMQPHQAIERHRTISRSAMGTSLASGDNEVLPLIRAGWQLEYN